MVDVGGDAVAAELRRGLQPLPRRRQRDGDAAVVATGGVQADEAAAAVDLRLDIAREPRVARRRQRPGCGVEKAPADAGRDAVSHACTRTTQLLLFPHPQHGWNTHRIREEIRMHARVNA